MTHDEMIEVIKAHKEGKKLECRLNPPHASEPWTTINSPVFDFHNFDYRVKKEPVELWAVGYGVACALTYTSEAAARKSAATLDGKARVFLMREVLDA